MEDFESLVAAVDIVDYIGNFTDLELRSDGEYWGLSPLKEEKTPSFSVNPNKQMFYDFSSGESGNLVCFIKAYYDCSACEVAKKLSEYIQENGITIGQNGRLDATKVCKRYEASAKRVEPAKDEEAHILPDTIMDKYVYDEDSLKIWIDEGITPEVLQEFNVRYDVFTDRIVYPIRNIEGQIVNIGARTLDPDYKVKGLRKYSYSQGWGGQMDVIYGMYENWKNAKEKRYLILFEGAKSVLKAAAWGIRNTGAILTSHLNPSQLRLLLSTCCFNNVAVVFALDKDINIADDKNIQKLKEYINVYYLSDIKNLLSEKDSPVDKGLDVFRELCAHKVELR